jgi:hypothetical protein
MLYKLTMSLIVIALMSCHETKADSVELLCVAEKATWTNYLLPAESRDRDPHYHHDDIKFSVKLTANSETTKITTTKNDPKLELATIEIFLFEEFIELDAGSDGGIYLSVKKEEEDSEIMFSLTETIHPTKVEITFGECKKV